MAVYVGRWDCDYCGNVGNLGPHIHCSECGSARPADVVFYMPRGIDTEVTDEAELAAAKDGSNWVCAYCSSSNSTGYKACVSCGGLKESSKKDLAVKEFLEDAVPRSSEPAKKLTTETKPKSKSKGFVSKILAVLTVIAGYFGLDQITSTIEVPVTTIEWVRNIEIEEFKLIKEEAWDLPKEGKLIRSFEAVHHYDKKIIGYKTRTRTVKEAVGSEEYVCGKRDLGNGYFEDKYCTRTIYENREEQYEEAIYQEFPVNRTKYEYEIYRWQPYEKYETKGSDKLPKWATLPDFINNDSQKFKIKSKKQAYYFAIKDNKDETRWYKSDFDYWDKEVFISKTLKAEKSMLFGGFKGLEVGADKVVEVDRE
jgi:hypothetical protein